MDHRIEKLERAYRDQGYALAILFVFIVIESIVVVVIWEEKGPVNYDHIAVSLTIFQTLFGIAALYGFWALRGLTKERAEDVARDIAGQIATVLAEKIAAEVASEAAERIAAQEVRELAPSIILREVNRALETFQEEGAISDSAIEGIVASFDGKEEKDG